MKKIIALLVVLAVAVACQKDEVPIEKQDSFNHEMTTSLLKSGGVLTSTPYCEVGPVEGKSISSNSDPDYWDFYTFEGNVGDEISVHIDYYGGNVVGNLYFGTATTTTGVYWYDGGPDMTYIMHICWWSSPPVIMEGDSYTYNYTLEWTGTYTIGMMTEGGTSYNLSIDGVVCDTDGDGCPDTEDPIVNSNMEEFVDIDGCSYGVPNMMTSECGVMMSDVIDELEAGEYKNHGAFVKEVAQLTEMWMMEGLITLEEKDLLVACAGESSIGFKVK